MSKSPAVDHLSRFDVFPNIKGYEAAAEWVTRELRVPTTKTRVRRCYQGKAQPPVDGKIVGGKLCFSERELARWALAAPPSRVSANRTATETVSSLRKPLPDGPTVVRQLGDVHRRCAEIVSKAQDAETITKAQAIARRCRILANRIRKGRYVIKPEHWTGKAEDEFNQITKAIDAMEVSA